MHAAIARCCASVLRLCLGAAVPDDPASQSCGSEAPALLEAALLADITDERQVDRELACVVVALREGPASLLDPPDSVVFSLKRRAKLQVVPVSNSERCPDGPLVWASQPRCSRSRTQAGVETSRAQAWCPRGFFKSGGRWVPYRHAAGCWE